jgi:glycosyltransferase involved in cell wall biosynthesis
VFDWKSKVEYIEWAIFVGLIVFFIIQLYYYIRIYFRTITEREFTKKQLNIPFSVIICARNEAENLKSNLKYILEQKFNEFEVIVVNDCSTDHTDEVLGEYVKKYKHLRITTIPLDRKFSHGKKLAVTVGVKSAKYENLIFTDADCKPVSDEWLKFMATGFMHKDIVLGYGGYQYEKSFLNNYIRYETLTVALTYLGFALIGKPYMGVGRNMGYKKTLFFKNKGFAKNYGLLSGDDDLFINEVASKENTKVIIDPKSFTVSEPKHTWGAYFKQKIRHLSTSGKYKKKHVLMLGLEPVSRSWYYFLLVVMLFCPKFINYAIVIALFRATMQIILYFTAGKRFGEKKLWLTCIIFDVISLFYNFIAYFALSIRSRKIKWK